MREFYAIRHAESAMNIKPQLVGGRSNEAELTERGIEQARALGKVLLDVVGTPGVVYSSPAIRTRETARHACDVAGISPGIILDESLYEMDQGDAVGHNRADVYTPAVLDEIARQGKDFSLPGGESMNDVGTRMRDWPIRHEAEADDRPLVVFGHGLAIRCLASTLHDWTHQQTLETELMNASITRFVEIAKRWTLDYKNRVK